MAKKEQVPEGNHQSEGVETARNGGLVLVACTLTGVSPMLQNAMSEETLIGLAAGPASGGKRPTKERPLPRDKAANGYHKLGNGEPCCPPSALYSCFVNAGQYVRLDGKRQVSTLQKTVLPGMMLIQDATLPLYVPGEDFPSAWEVDIQRGAQPQRRGGGLHHPPPVRCVGDSLHAGSGHGTDAARPRVPTGADRGEPYRAVRLPPPA